MKVLAFLALCAATLAGQTTPPPTAVIGTVLDEATGSPLPRVNISLSPLDPAEGAARPQPRGENLPIAATLSGTDGAFRFDGVKPGRYVVRARRPGYFPAPGTQVVVHTTALPDALKISLRPQTVVSGNVVDENGEPVDEVSVQLVQAQQRRGMQFGSVGSAAVDDRGAFRLVTAAAGEFYLVAQPLNPLPSTSTPGAILAPTFYPSAAAVSGAELVFLKPGANAANLTIKLRSSRAFKIKGRAVDASGTPMQQASIMVNPMDLPPGGNQLRVELNETGGTFEIENVIPGRYRVITMIAPDPQTRRQGSWAATEVNVKDSDVEGVEIKILPPVTVSGTVDIPLPPMPAGGPTDIVPVEGIETRPKIRVGLNPVVWDGMTRSYSGEAKEDGSFTIDGVQPGTYEIAAGFQYGAYLASVQLNGQETLGKPLNVTSKIESLHLTYKTDGGTLRATVQGERPSGSNPPLIAIVPVNPEQRRPPFLLVFQMTMGRQVTIPRLRPGDYLIWIFDRFGSYEQLADVEFVKRIEVSARRVEVEPDGDVETEVPLTRWP